MGEIVNLRRFRKTADRHARDTEAAANRAKHGQTKAERLVAEAQRHIDERKLEAHRRDDPYVDPA